MRIALLTPTYWPEVRRGTERLVHDLAVALHGRGHAVSVLTTHRGPSSRASEAGAVVERLRRPPGLPGLSAYEYHVLTIPGTMWRLARSDFDIAHSFFPSDSWAAVRAKRLGGPPVVATLHGIPTRSYLVARRYRLEMLHEVVRRADECTVLSEAAAAPFERFLLRRPIILGGGVDTKAFSPSPRKPEPTFFCASSLGDPRKRADLLFAAFEQVRRLHPGTRLRLAPTSDPFMSNTRLALPPGVEVLGAHETLAEAYASAWATVNAGAGEAFGLVMVESLAAGTPVIADEFGAASEIFKDPAAGATFATGDQRDLTRAMLAAAKRPPSGEQVECCLETASRFDWEKVVQDYEAVYERVLSVRSRGIRA